MRSEALVYSLLAGLGGVVHTVSLKSISRKFSEVMLKNLKYKGKSMTHHLAAKRLEVGACKSLVD